MFMRTKHLLMLFAAAIAGNYPKLYKYSDIRENLRTSKCCKRDVLSRSVSGMVVSNESKSKHTQHKP